jgi:hypothetical protein
LNGLTKQFPQTEKTLPPDDPSGRKNEGLIEKLPEKSNDFLMLAMPTGLDRLGFRLILNAACR